MKKKFHAYFLFIHTLGTVDWIKAKKKNAAPTVKSKIKERRHEKGTN